MVSTSARAYVSLTTCTRVAAIGLLAIRRTQAAVVDSCSNTVPKEHGEALAKQTNMSQKHIKPPDSLVQRSSRHRPRKAHVSTVVQSEHKVSKDPVNGIKETSHHCQPRAASPVRASTHQEHSMRRNGNRADASSSTRRRSASSSARGSVTIPAFMRLTHGPINYLAAVVRQGPGSPSKITAQHGDNRSPLLAIKLLFFLFYASLGSLMPYLPVYYHSLGIPDSRLGVLGAITPAITFLVSPLWGYLADSTGRHKDILLFTFTSAVIARLAFVWKKSFTWLCGLVSICAVLNAPVRPLLDSSVLNLLEDKREYGKQRLWGQFGFGIAGFIVGPLLMNHKLGGYKAAFIIHAILSLPTLLIMAYFKLAPASKPPHPPPSPAPAPPDSPVVPPKVPYSPLISFLHEKTNALSRRVPQLRRIADLAPNLGPPPRVSEADRVESRVAPAPSHTDETNSNNRNSRQAATPRFREGLRLLLRNPDTCVFFFMVFVIGVSSGIIENFAYKRLREVGGQGTVMGVSRGISSVAGVPMFWFSGELTKNLSVMGVLTLSILSYIVRFVIYALIRNPWQGLPAEALRGMTFAAMWASSTYYTHRISPPGLSATMLGFLNGMYGGLGQSTGALLGGHLSHLYGTPKAFLLAAAADVIVVIIFGTYWFLHPHATKLKEEKT